MRALTSDRTWRSGQPPERVWETVLDFGSYRSWWPWLIEFDAPPVATGSVARAVVRAPARYRLRLTLTLADVDQPALVLIHVGGDLSGRASVALRPHGDGTELTLHWSLRPNRRLLNALAIVARPVLVHGHDRILDDGLRRFVAANGLDLVEIQGPEGSRRGMGARD